MGEENEKYTAFETAFADEVRREIVDHALLERDGRILQAERDQLIALSNMLGRDGVTINENVTEEQLTQIAQETGIAEDTLQSALGKAKERVEEKTDAPSTYTPEPLIEPVSNERLQANQEAVNALTGERQMRQGIDAYAAALREAQEAAEEEAARLKAAQEAKRAEHAKRIEDMQERAAGAYDSTPRRKKPEPEETLEDVFEDFINPPGENRYTGDAKKLLEDANGENPDALDVLNHANINPVEPETPPTPSEQPNDISQELLDFINAKKADGIITEDELLEIASVATAAGAQLKIKDVTADNKDTIKLELGELKETITGFNFEEEKSNGRDDR